MSNRGIPEGIRLDKRKGQCILIDENVITRQIEYANLRTNDTALEIGPGLGALTFPMAERALKVVAVEQDKEFYGYLKERVPENVSLILGDALRIELPKFDICVSNLPYGISSPITFMLLERDFRDAILMYQREFAQRMVASPGESAYSRLTVSVYFRAYCEILELVPRTAFHPKPDVDSAIVRLSPRESPFNLESEELFFDMLNVLFSQRRKKIRNSLTRLIKGELRKTGVYSESCHKRILEALPFSELRVGVLTPEDLGRLSNELYGLLSDEKEK